MSGAALGANLSTEIYSEQGYLGREDLMLANFRFRVGQELAPSLKASLQVGTEVLTATPADRTLDSGGSYLYAGPVLKYTLGKVSLIGELRARRFYHDKVTPTSPQRVLDARALVVYGDIFQTRLAPESPLWGFIEVYGEGLFTSGDLYNVIGSAFVRAGGRWKVGPGLNVDLFVEPFVALDRVRHYYNNRADVKPSLRVEFWSGSFSFSLIGSVVFNRYFSFGDFERNPYADRNTGLRVLSIIGGTF